MLTVDDVAKQLGVGRSTAMALLMRFPRGVIDLGQRRSRYLRIDPEALDAYIRGEMELLPRDGNLPRRSTPQNPPKERRIPYRSYKEESQR